MSLNQEVVRQSSDGTVSASFSNELRRFSYQTRKGLSTDLGSLKELEHHVRALSTMLVSATAIVDEGENNPTSDSREVASLGERLSADLSELEEGVLSYAILTGKPEIATAFEDLKRDIDLTAVNTNSDQSDYYSRSEGLETVGLETLATGVIELHREILELDTLYDNGDAGVTFSQLFNGTTGHAEIASELKRQIDRVCGALFLVRKMAEKLL